MQRRFQQQQQKSKKMNEIHYRQLCNIENFNIYLLVNKFYQQDFTYHIKLLLKIKLNHYESDGC